MKGILKFSQWYLDHLTPELDTLVKQFISRGIVHKTVRDPQDGNVYFCLSHPDFDNDDKDTEYTLYVGNRYDRATSNIEPRILRLDKIIHAGRSTPVRYYTDNEQACKNTLKVQW